MKIFSSNLTTFYVDPNGHCHAAGTNKDGQLGLGHSDFIFEFRPIDTLPPSVRVKQIACSTTHTVLLTETGDCYATGKNDKGQLGVGDNSNRNSYTKIIGLPREERVIQMLCSREHTVLLTAFGNCYATGNNQYGQLGVGDYNNRNVFTKVEGLSVVTQLRCSDTYTILLTASGQCYATGQNNAGQLGVGDNNNRNLFTQVRFLEAAATRITQVICSSLHTLLLTETGCCYATGMNLFGEIGVGDNRCKNTFTLVSGVPTNLNVVQVATSANHTLLLTACGRCYATGRNNFGQLGVGDEMNKKTFFAIKGLPANETVVKLRCYDNHTALITNTNTVYTAGFNGSGQLGVGDKNNRNTFTQVRGLTPNTSVVSLAGNAMQTTLLTAKNQFYATGAIIHNYGISYDRENKCTFQLAPRIGLAVPTLVQITMVEAVSKYGFGNALFTSVPLHLLEKIATHYRLALCKSHQLLRPQLFNPTGVNNTTCCCPDCKMAE